MRTAEQHAAASLPTGTPDDAFAEAIIEGLSRSRKSLPCRYFYDERGSELFEDITRLPEYYPTQAEIEILTDHAEELARGVDANTVIIEFGSGSSRKTELLLAAMPQIRAYIPIDVSDSALDEARDRLAARFSKLDIRPVHGDFSTPVQLPADLAGCKKLGFFPGSTIGNLTRAEAGGLLKAMRKVLAPAGRLVIGVDLVKDEQTLLLAYNDPAGVTADFNMNLLARINRTFGQAFNLDAFRHEAIFNAKDSRIEMHLVSTSDQTVSLFGRRFRLRAGETIHTENSHKYAIEQFQDLARSAGWRSRRVLTDARRLFSVHELVSA